MASGQHVTVPIPRRRPTREGERSTQVPLEQGESEKAVVMPSLHNWVEQVYKAFNQTFPTGANEVVLLGVREMSRTAGETRADDTYTRNTRSAERGDQTSHDDGGDETTTWDDLLFAVWTESTPEESTKARVYACTIDPSTDLTDTTGSPYLLEGKLYRTDPGPHDGNANALHIYTATPGSIMVAREATKEVRVFRAIESALVPPSSTEPQRWEFVATETNDTFHVHWGFNYASTSHRAENFSAGCTVLLHRRGSDVYKAFISLTHGAANSDAIPYLVVSSAYINMPDVWAASAAEDPDQLQDPAYTLRAAGLVRAPAPLVGYLPSFMTFEFAQQVLKLAGDVENVSAAVGGGDVEGLDESLANVVNLEHDHSALPRSVPGLLGRWSAARGAGAPFPDAERAQLLEGLSGLNTNLRNSLERACFQTVLATQRGPR